MNQRCRREHLCSPWQTNQWLGYREWIPSQNGWRRLGQKKINISKQGTSSVKDKTNELLLISGVTYRSESWVPFPSLIPTLPLFLLLSGTLSLCSCASRIMCKTKVIMLTSHALQLFHYAAGSKKFSPV